MEHVRKTEDGFEVVCDNGDRVPAVEQDDAGKAPCPYGCPAGTHVHGVDTEPLGHRVAHCPEKTPESGQGYFLMRPALLGLFEAPVRWWEIEGATPPRLDTRPRWGGLGGLGGFVGIEGVDVPPSNGSLLSGEGN